MKKIIFSLIVVLLFTTVSVQAQENPRIKRDEFERGDNKDALKEAMSHIRKGNLHYTEGLVGSYQEALEYFLKAFKYNEDNAALNYKIGVSLVITGPKEQAVRYLNAAFEKEPEVASDLLFWMARAYHYAADFKTAHQYYNKFWSQLSNSDQKKYETAINLYRQQAKNGMDLRVDTVEVLITNLGDNVNSIYHDYGPFLSDDEGLLYFTSRRPNPNDKNPPRNPLDKLYYEDIYFSFKVNDLWEPAQRLASPINTEDNDAVVNIEPDGSKIYIYRGVKSGGSILYSERKEDKWSNPSTMPNAVSSREKESAITISRDGKTIYFVSEDPKNSQGGKDIFYTTRQKNGWSKPENMGPRINTAFDENAVFIDHDNKTLYFSSKGHNSIGGYDVFKTTLQDNGTWSMPENLGYPVNTTYDDLFYSMTEKGKIGYYSSTRYDSRGGSDIYQLYYFQEKPTPHNLEDELLATGHEVFTDLVMEAPIELKMIDLTIVSGIIKSDDVFMRAEITFTDLETDEMLSKVYSDSITGEYVQTLPPGKNYGMAVNATGYLFHSENFNIPDTAKYQELQRDIVLSKVSLGAKVVLNNVFFDSGKSDLRQESINELKNLKSLMDENTNIIIEISGHTDNTGTKATNEQLSEDRAKAVVDKLLELGVAAKRLEYKGYADTQPVANNMTEAGRQKNRRVEAKIVGF